MSKDSKKQATSPTTELRSRIINSGIKITTIAAASSLKYPRVYRIVQMKSNPTFDEGVALQQALEAIGNGLIQSS